MATRMTTRSMSVTDCGGEVLCPTKDPIQVTFDTTPTHLPYWRYVIIQRYCERMRPEHVQSTMFERTKQDKQPVQLPTTLVKPLPYELWHTQIHTYLEEDKVITFHIYYSTNKFLIQGYACED